jgi:glycosyltransferase involved in cell wall biosynthesis
MTRELKKQKHEVYIFCPKYPGERDIDPNVYRFSSLRFTFYKGMRWAIPYSRKAFRLIPGLEIIHSHDPGPIGLLALWSAERYHIPHIHTYHNLYMDYRRYLPLLIRPTRGTVKRMSRLLCNRCDAVISPSEPMKRELESYGINCPIYTLSFGVDIEEFSHEIKWNVRESLNLPTEDLLLYAGRLGKEKNLEFLLHSFGLLLSQRPTARLVIAGDGPHREALKHYTESLRLTRYVTFTGFLKREDLVDLYKQATLFVFSSKTDTQGLVIMEAMMAGTPVVAVNILGPLGVIDQGKTGILVNEDEEEFADACLNLLVNEDERNKIGVAAREWARTNSAQESTRKLLDIYSTYLNVKKPKL